MGIIAGLVLIGLMAGLLGSGGGDEGPEPVPTTDDDIYMGQDGDDSYEGSADDEILLGGAGNDVLYGRDGTDLIVGEAGDDALHGGSGDDILLGGDGDDTLFGGPGDDQMVGGAGDDSLGGGEGDDVLIGGTGSDTLNGGEGDDVLDGRDVYSPADMADLDAALGRLYALQDGSLPAGLLERIGGDLAVRGEPGSDQLNGGQGNDWLIGDSGDTLHGGDGIDQFYIAHDGTAEFQAVHLTDFDAALEHLEIVLPDGMLQGALSFTAQGSNTLIAMGGAPLALVSGATPAELLAASIEVSGGIVPTPPQA